MTWGGVCVTADRFYIDLNIPNGLCAVNDRQDVSTLRQRDDFTDRHSQARRRDHMADTDHPGLLCYCAFETLEDGFDVMVFRRYHDSVYAHTSSLLKMFPNGAASFV